MSNNEEEKPLENVDNIISNPTNNDNEKPPDNAETKDNNIENQNVNDIIKNKKEEEKKEENEANKDEQKDENQEEKKDVNEENKEEIKEENKEEVKKEEENQKGLDEIIKDKPELYPAAVSLIPLAIYNKIGLDQKELRKEILLRAMSIVEEHKDICAQWDVYKTMVLMSTGDGSDAVRFIHSRIKDDTTYKTRLEVWPAYSGGFWKAYAEDVEKLGLK